MTNIAGREFQRYLRSYGRELHCLIEHRAEDPSAMIFRVRALYFCGFNIKHLELFWNFVTYFLSQLSPSLTAHYPPTLQISHEAWKKQ